MLTSDALGRGRGGGCRGGRRVGTVQREHHDSAVAARNVLLAVGVLFRRAVHIIQSLVQAEVYLLHLLLAFGIGIAANVRSEPE